jgi:hypothetical protein
MSRSKMLSNTARRTPARYAAPSGRTSRARSGGAVKRIAFYFTRQLKRAFDGFVFGCTGHHITGLRRTQLPTEIEAAERKYSADQCRHNRFGRCPCCAVLN